MEPTGTGQPANLAVPIAIVLAGVLIAGALYFTKGTSAPNGNNKPVTAPIIAPVTANDHILGDPNAPVIIVEYSDTECPFCKTFHNTLNQIMNEYGKDGKVAWVYRHFPLDSIHSKADKEAEAVECAWELGGETAFWKYLSRIFEVTPSNNKLDLALLPKIATEIGLDSKKFEECLDSGKYAGKVEDMYQSGLTAGVRGTPNSFILARKDDGSYEPVRIVTQDGESYSLGGAYPYATVVEAINAALGQ